MTSNKTEKSDVSNKKFTKIYTNLSFAIQEILGPTTRFSGEMIVGPILLYVLNYNNISYISV
jgi:hypothetical protein